MKLIAIAALGAFVAVSMAQTDHDNIDRGRPLSFEDAEPIATRGLAYEFGLNFNFLRGKRMGFEFPFEIIWGGAPDTQFELGTSALFGNRAGTTRTGFDLKGFEFGVMHSFNRELPNAPALALKVEAESEGSGFRKTHYRITGIATKSVRQYDRLHVNAGIELAPSAGAGENKARLNAVLGYTKPLGYPRHFDTTGLAEFSLKQGERRGDMVTGIGIGMRRQISPRSVLDIGLQSELTGRNRIPLRLIIGYSTSL